MKTKLKELLEANSVVVENELKKYIQLNDSYGLYASLEAEDVKKELGAVHDNVKTITTRMAEVLEKTQNKEQTQQQAQTQNKGSRNREER